MPCSNKLDFNLQQALRAFEESGAPHDDSAGITVSLRFEGDLADIEALGFDPIAVDNNQARGVVWFKDIPALVEHPGVLWMSVGYEPEIETDTAVPDILARADTKAKVGVNGLWYADDVASGTLTHGANDTGAGVIVAVIDTGIDYTHPAFMKQLTPTKQTRILRIWDMGLVATVPGDSPAAALLDSNPRTYGVEYDDGEIDAAINAAPPFVFKVHAHMDCIGHGTHVAAIAAGGVKFPVGGDAKHVGVAPEADIIAVKLLDIPTTIMYGTSGAPGATVDPPQRFRDAVLYCLRTAHALGKPIVINMSFGNVFEPGDALDEEAVWLDKRLDPATPADGGVHQFPTGAVVVKSCGNSGSAKKRQTATFTVPAGGLTIPIELIDSRGVLQRKWKNCARQLYKPFVGAIFWYRRTTPPTAVEFSVRLPHQTVFNPPQTVGNTFQSSFRVNPPWPFTTALHPLSTARHSVFLHHEDTPDVTIPAGTVRRKRALFFLRPKVNSLGIHYLESTYEVKITAPVGTVVHCLCLRKGWAPKKGVVCQIAKKMANGDPLPPTVTAGLTTDSSAVDTLGKHAITVAAYNDADGLSLDLDRHAIAEFSSQGPLRDFSDPPRSIPAIASKPDVAAPGVKINAAHSVKTETLLPRLPPWLSGIRFTEKSGTSMAAPMVAGVVALMLDKKPTLNSTEARTFLNGGAATRPGAHPVSPPDPPSAVTNAFGSGMVHALKSHTDTT